MAQSTEYKAKRKLIASVLKNFQSWLSLIESSHGSYTITVLGEEYHYLDFLDGLAVIPPRQRLAVWLLCIEDKSEAEAARLMNFKTWPTPIQQYKNFGLKRFMEYLEADGESRQEMLDKAGRKYDGKMDKAHTERRAS